MFLIRHHLPKKEVFLKNFVSCTVFALTSMRGTQSNLVLSTESQSHETLLAHSHRQMQVSTPMTHYNSWIIFALSMEAAKNNESNNLWWVKSGWIGKPWSKYKPNS